MRISGIFFVCIALLKLKETNYNYRMDDEYEENFRNNSLLRDTVRAAAEAGDATSQCIMGEAYIYGLGVEEDHTEAIKWHKQAAEQGNAAAQFAIGYAYEFGHGVDKNLVEAAKWYQLGADQRNADSLYSLGKFYDLGKGVEMDKAKAKQLYSLAIIAQS